MSIGQHAWHFGIGDPNVTGWSITLGYLTTAFFSFLHARHYLASRAIRHARFWLMISLFLLLMGINKQLDLQILLLETAKSFSLQYGFYQHRHSLVVAFIGTLLLWGAASQAWLYSGLKRLHRPERWALIGLGIAFAFIASRAAYFQHLVGPFEQSPRLAQWIYWFMEFAIIGCIARATYGREWGIHLRTRISSVILGRQATPEQSNM